MSAKHSKKPDFSRTTPQVEAIKRMLKETVAHIEKENPFADWLRHEACGHNPLAEGMVLYGLTMEESWNWVLARYGVSKAQGFRRRIYEAKEAFTAKRK